MDENRTQRNTAAGNSSIKALLPFTEEDIRIIKESFGKKRKIVYYIMSALFITGTGVSSIAIFIETQRVNRLNSTFINDQQMHYSINYWELLIPFFVGTGIVLILVLVLIMFYQELNIELNNNRKYIYRGSVTKRTEKATRVGSGKDRDTRYDYYIHLGDICFEHKDLYFEMNEGDRIDVEISEKLGIVLKKNIIKNKAVAGIAPEKTGEFGIFDIVSPGHQVIKRTESMTDEEVKALENLKKKRFKKIITAASVFIIGLGITCELNLWHDHYTWDQALAMRSGLWGIPMAFFGLLYYWKVFLLSKDIRLRDKLIISEKVIDKEEYVRASSQEVSYYIQGLTERTDVSWEFFNSLKAGSDYEIHKTKPGERFLSLLIPSTGMKYKNPEIFSAKKV